MELRSLQTTGANLGGGGYYDLGLALDFTGLLNFNSSLNRFEGTISSAALNGNAEAFLFGPGSEEFGGLFEMSGFNGQVQYGGAFGGARD